MKKLEERKVPYKTIETGGDAGAKNLDAGPIDAGRGLDFATISDLFGRVMDCKIGSRSEHVEHISNHFLDHQWLYGRPSHRPRLYKGSEVCLC